MNHILNLRYNFIAIYYVFASICYFSHLPQWLFYLLLHSVQYEKQSVYDSHTRLNIVTRVSLRKPVVICPSVCQSL